MTDIKSWSTTAPQNNDAAPNGFPEGMAPSGLNDAAREVMAAVRRQWNDAQWFDYGDGGNASTYAFVSSDQFKVVSNPAADLTGEYHVGRRLKVAASTPGTIYGTVTASLFSSPDTTVTVAFDSGSLVNEALTVFLSVQRADNQGTPGALVVGDGTAASPSMRFSGDVDSGLFLKSAGEVGLSVGGVEQVTFKDDGTVTGLKLGGWEKIDQKNAINLAEHDFTTGLSDLKYQRLRLVVETAKFNSNDAMLALRMRRVGQALFDSSGYRYIRHHSAHIRGFAFVSDQSEVQINMAPNIRQSSSRTMHGEIDLLHSAGGDVKQVRWNLAYTDSGAEQGLAQAWGTGTLDLLTDAIDGVRLRTTDGSLFDLVATLYGLRR